MGFLESVGIEFIHFVGLLLLGAIGALIVLWRDSSRYSDRLTALEVDYEKEKELIHKRISEHERERKEEFNELRHCINDLRSDFRELTGKLEVWTQNWASRKSANPK